MVTSSQVQPGYRVRVRMYDEEEEWTVVGAEEESNHRHFRTSQEAPLGRALMGHAAGETVKMGTPGGITTVTIVAVLAPEPAAS